MGIPELRASAHSDAARFITDVVMGAYSNAYANKSSLWMLDHLPARISSRRTS